MSFARNFGLLNRSQPRQLAEVIQNLTVRINFYESDQRFEEKYAALRKGIDLVGHRVPDAFVGMPVLPVYLGEHVDCEVAWQPEGPDGEAFLFLGDRMMFQTNRLGEGQPQRWGGGQEGLRGVADQVYDDHRKKIWDPARWRLALQNQYKASKVSAKAAAVVVHELGHLLHERNAREMFWKHKKLGAVTVPAALAMEVSNYACGNNYDEFVAEVFTGLVYGKVYPRDVLVAYEEQGGPEVR